jgi:hypothetical protein
LDIPQKYVEVFHDAEVGKTPAGGVVKLVSSVEVVIAEDRYQDILALYGHGAPIQTELLTPYHVLSLTAFRRFSEVIDKGPVLSHSPH